MTKQNHAFDRTDGASAHAGPTFNATASLHSRKADAGRARLQQPGLSKPQVNITAALVAAALGLYPWAAQAQSAVNLVLDTGSNTALPSRITGTGAPVVRVGPSNPTATINGVTIRYLGTQSVTPLVSDPVAPGPTAAATMGRFVVLGDLNLASNQSIFGIGPNLVQLEVGNNAKIAAGATIDFSAQGLLSGAGGGGGGTAGPDAAVGYRVSPQRFTADFSTRIYPVGGIAGTSATNYRGANGLSITQPYYTTIANPTIDYFAPGTVAYRDLFRSNAGGAGQAGQGNLATAAGGAARVHSGFEPPGVDPGVAAFIPAAAGTGGGGGQYGGFDSFGFAVSGGNGGNGGNGGTGTTGLNAASAAPIVSTLNPTVISLRAGNGGGAGATGGAGLPGGFGGGAGGGGSSGNLDRGGNGGDGGSAGQGGNGGAGGAGGGGGGGLQLLVRGQLTLDGQIFAVGGQGGAGVAGALGAAGGAGTAGAAGETGSLFVRGGNGGNGGAGGQGGRGGTGGNGMGGTGGVVQIVASNLSYSGSTFTQGGLSGNGIDRSANGASYIHAFSGPSAAISTPEYFGARAAGANPYRSFSSTILFNGPPAGSFPNVPAVQGGAAAYGMLDESVNGAIVWQNIQTLAESAAPAPLPGHKRVGAVTRVNARWLANLDRSEFNNDSQDVMLFTAFTGNLPRPALMSVDPAHQAIFGDYIPAAPVPLRQGHGYLNDPSITPGAVTPTDMTTLSARSTFAMYGSGTQNITAAFTPYAAPRFFSGTPTPAGNIGAPGASTVFLEDRGLLRLGVVARSVDANRNASATSQRETTGSFETTATANLRAGGNSIIVASAQGVGNVDTATSGTAAIRTLQRPGGTVTESGPLYTQATVRYDQVGRGQFWGSADIPINTSGLAIGTTQRVAEVVFTPEYDHTTRTITAPVDARIFGPTPRLQGPGTSGNSFTFSAIQAGSAVISRFSLQNADVLSSLGAPWSNAISADPELIRLTILGFELIDTAGVFSVSGIGNMPMPFSLEGNQTAPVDIRFNASLVGNYSATLRFLTDMNAALGLAGDYYEVSLFATAVDEPPSLLLLLGGSVALLLRLRRRGGSCVN